jgi:hypothetical protein
MQFKESLISRIIFFFVRSRTKLSDYFTDYPVFDSNLAVLKGFLEWHDKSRKLGVGTRKEG